VEPAEITRVKFFHRPSVTRHGCRLIFGCSCGARVHPCAVLVAALEEERAADPEEGAGEP
jgi:hypothetical protein